MSRTLNYTLGAIGVIAGTAIAGFGSGIGNAYGAHLMHSGQLPLPGAPRRRGRRNSPSQRLVAFEPPPTKFNPEKPYMVETVRNGHKVEIYFDPRNGLGAVPDTANVNYKGFVAWLTPHQFLCLNPLRQVSQKDLTRFTAALQTGEAIGTPFLDVRHEEPFRGRYVFRVTGHEGRGRMSALAAAGLGAVPIPVAIFVSGDRARHLDPNMLYRANIHADRRRNIPRTRGEKLRCPLVAVDVFARAADDSGNPLSQPYFKGLPVGRSARRRR